MVDWLQCNGNIINKGLMSQQYVNHLTYKELGVFIRVIGLISCYVFRVGLKSGFVSILFFT